MYRWKGVLRCSSPTRLEIAGSHQGLVSRKALLLAHVCVDSIGNPRKRSRRWWRKSAAAMALGARRGQAPAMNWIKQMHKRDAQGLERKKGRRIRAWVPLYQEKSATTSHYGRSFGDEIRGPERQPGGVECWRDVVCYGILMSEIYTKRESVEQREANNSWSVTIRELMAILAILRCTKMGF
jgi:hypothetical protein